MTEAMQGRPDESMQQCQAFVGWQMALLAALWSAISLLLVVCAAAPTSVCVVGASQLGHMRPQAISSRGMPTCTAAYLATCDSSTQ